MNTEQLLLSRRTVHFYDPEKNVDPIVLERAMNTARFAPNHKLSNPLRLISVGEQTREKIVQLAIDVKSGGNPTPEIETRVRSKVGSSPNLVVVLQTVEDDPERSKEDYATCACAIQNMTLMLWADGVSSKWSTGGATKHEAIYEILGVDKTQLKVIGFVFAGYPRDGVPSTPRRLELSEILSTRD